MHADAFPPSPSPYSPFPSLPPSPSQSIPPPSPSPSPTPPPQSLTPFPGPAAAPQHRRLVVYPKGATGTDMHGHSVTGEGFLSVFMEVADDAESQPSDWSRLAYFSLLTVRR